MLIKATPLIGLDVISLDTGKKIEKVDDVLYDPNQQKVTGFVVDEAGLFSDAKVILFDDVKSIGSDALIVDNENVIKKASEVSNEIATIAKSSTHVTQKKVVTETGNELGVIDDLFFDDQTGQVEELNLSRGIRDAQGGKKRISVRDVVTVGKDATIVRSYAQTEIEHQPPTGGISTAVETVKEKIDSVSANVSSNMSNATEQAQAKVAQMQQNPTVEQTTQEVKSVAQDIGTVVSAKAKEMRDALREQAEEAEKKQAE